MLYPSSDCQPEEGINLFETWSAAARAAASAGRRARGSGLSARKEYGRKEYTYALQKAGTSSDLSTKVKAGAEKRRADLLRRSKSATGSKLKTLQSRFNTTHVRNTSKPTKVGNYWIHT